MKNKKNVETDGERMERVFWVVKISATTCLLLLKNSVHLVNRHRGLTLNSHTPPHTKAHAYFCFSAVFCSAAHISS